MARLGPCPVRIEEVGMSDDNMDVLVAAYLSVDDAERDFEALLAEITAKRVKVDSAIVVVKDPDGTVSVRDTGDKAGRKGAKWGAGVGLLVGLAAPPLIGAVAVGAAGGAAVGKIVGHKARTGIEEKVGDALKSGTAVVMVLFESSQRLGIEQALPGSPAKSIAPLDGVRELKDALAVSQDKEVPKTIFGQG